MIRRGYRRPPRSTDTLTGLSRDLAAEVKRRRERRAAIQSAITTRPPICARCRTTVDEATTLHHRNETTLIVRCHGAEESRVIDDVILAIAEVEPLMVFRFLTEQSA